MMRANSAAAVRLAGGCRQALEACLTTLRRWTTKISCFSSDELIQSATTSYAYRFARRFARVLALLSALAITLSAADAYTTELLPPGSSTTMWSVARDRKTILISVNGGAPKPFIIKGVDYSPRPINDAAITVPSTDYFWGDPAHLTYGPIWTRDVWGTTYNSGQARIDLPDGLVRQLGANSIRTYAWWKWVPMVPEDYSKGNTLDWSVNPRVRFGDTTAPAGFAQWPAH